MVRTNDRLGETKINNQGCEMKIVRYGYCDDIDILFPDYDYVLKNRTYRQFKNGCVSNPFYPSVYNTGYIGDKHPTSINGELTPEYIMWFNMFVRSYNKKLKERYPTYKDATVAEEWHCFTNFHDWLYTQPNFYKHKNKELILCVDKDILKKHNKIYSSETVTLVPQTVNILFIKNNKMRGDLPIGVYDRGKYGYSAKCGDPREKTGVRFLGHHQTIEEAFEQYKKHKEEVIKYVADREFAAGNITEQCRDAMYRYQVEITD